MKTAFKIAGLSALLFGQSLCLVAQTDWYNPAADSLLPIQGRAWNAERFTSVCHSGPNNWFVNPCGTCRYRQQDFM